MNLSREPAFGLMMLYRWPVLALLWIFVNVFMPSAASASSSSGVENRVWDFFAQEQVCVGSVATLSPGLHPGCELAYDDWTSGSPLAAKGGLRPTQPAVSGPQVDRLAADMADMAENGFDPRFPVKVDGDLVVDGHHRAMAIHN